MEDINKKKFYKSWLFWIFLLIILSMINLDGDKKNEKKSSDMSFKSELNAKCKAFHAARQECATAGNYSQCMTIKGGGNPNYAEYINIC